eukprot:gene13459-14844_t
MFRQLTLKYEQQEICCRLNVTVLCDSERDSDGNKYNEGGLGRCSVESAQVRLIVRKNIYMKDLSHRFYQVSKRLDILLSGQSHDIFAVDVFYHQSCYIKFALVKLQITGTDLNNEKKQDVIQSFFYQVRTRIIRDKSAFLLNELLEDIKNIRDEQGLLIPAVKHTSTLKKKLIMEFRESFAFFPSGKYLLVHAADVNPCEYAIAALHGCGLRDDDLARSFARMVRWQLHSYKQKKQWPLTPSELTEMLDRGPLQSLYNAIFYTIYDFAEKNEYGYACTNSHIKAIKIWSLASDWESLITKEPSAKQAVMGLVIHRMTGSKEVANMLHKCNHAISYQDIRTQNMSWSRMISSRQLLLSNMRKGVSMHSTLDNNDGKQETMTGADTTHDTNKTLFQLPTNEEKENIETIGSEAERRLGISDNVDNEPAESLVQFITPAEESEAVQIGLINDTFKIDSIKSGARKKRGESEMRLKIDGFDQDMLQGSRWQDFLNIRENKEELIQLIAKYFKT